MWRVYFSWIVAATFLLSVLLWIVGTWGYGAAHWSLLGVLPSLVVAEHVCNVLRRLE